MPRVRWTPEEEKRLLDLITAGKSWTLISATLKRSMSNVKLHADTLRRAGPKKRATVHRDRAEGKDKEMSVRGSNWTAEEDRPWFDFIEVCKSWVFIAAALKRTTRSIQDRARELKAKGK